MTYENLFLIYLAITISIELIVLYLLIRFYYKIEDKTVSTGRLIFAGFVSFGTLPYVWFIFPELFKPNYLYISLSEIIVVILEAIFYYFVLNLGWKRAIIISFACNLVSVLSGFLINRIMPF
jgi:hypothetical protein